MAPLCRCSTPYSRDWANDCYVEDSARQRCGLPPLLGEQQSRELSVMVAQRETRAGSYADRVRRICGRYAEEIASRTGSGDAGMLVADPQMQLER